MLTLTVAAEAHYFIVIDAETLRKTLPQIPQGRKRRKEAENGKGWKFVGCEDRSVIKPEKDPCHLFALLFFKREIWRDSQLSRQVPSKATSTV